MAIPALFPASERNSNELLSGMVQSGYRPIIVNDCYIPHFNRQELVQIWYGGSGSGKSDAKATELLLKCLTRPYCRVLFLRKFREQVRDSQFLLFKDLIARYGLGQYFKVKESEMDLECSNGNKLLSGGLDDVDKLKSIPDVTDVWIEEPMDRKGSISSTDFTEILRRLRTPLASNHIHLTFNPISIQSWIYDYFFRSNEYGAFALKTTYLDNYYAPESERTKFEALKSKKPDEYKVYALGEWGSLKQGLVFQEYEICEAFPEDCKKTGYGLDWGFYPDPTALVRCGIKDGKLYLDEEIYETNHTSATRAAKMDRLGIKRGAKIVADRNPEAIAELKAKGFFNIIPAKKGEGSIKSGIDAMHGFQIVITRRSENLKTELDNYSWVADRHTETLTGVPEDRFNHAIDAARYWVMEEVVASRGVRFA